MDDKTLDFELLSQPNSPIFGPRLGRLSISGKKQMKTPTFLAITSRGAIPHITPDVISSTQVRGVYMALEDFIEKAAAGTPPIITCPANTSPLCAFACLPQEVITLLAPRRTPAVPAPSGNSDTAVVVFTSTGFQTLSNKAYINYLNELRPDIAVALADVPYGAAPGKKRLAKTGFRTQYWLTETLRRKVDGQAIFGPVLPMDYSDQSEYLDYLSEDLVNQIHGLAFYDANLIADIPVTTTISNLPRLTLDEPESPFTVLRQISQGMDIFTIPFVGLATDAGIALNFHFPRPPQCDTAADGTVKIPLGIDMWSSSHSTSLMPISESCSCYACKCHHRAFVRHLLSAKEMLGWVLLQIHNYHIISEFFASIRESVSEGTFDMNHNIFATLYEPELPEKSGQGPRVRGYHFKRNEPGETKKSEVPWENLGSDGPEFA